MTLNIKDRETDRLARELARTTGESITVAVKTAIIQRLNDAGRKRRPLAERLRDIQLQMRAAPRLTDQTDDEIVGYDEFGVPK